MIFRRRNNPDEYVKRLKEELEKEQKKLQADMEAYRNAGNVALDLAKRRELLKKVHLGEAAVMRASQKLEASTQNPAEEARKRQETAHEAEMARQTTLNYGKEAARLLREHFAATGENPDYSFVVKNTIHHTVSHPDGVTQKNVRGWLLFDEYESQSILNYPSMSPHISRWVHLYHGPVLLPNGEIRAFYDYEDVLGPGLQTPHRPIRLNGDMPDLRTTDYERYRGFYPAEEPLKAEYKTQQAIADLLDRYGVR